MDPKIGEISYYLANSRVQGAPSYTGVLKDVTELTKFISRCILGFVTGAQIIVRGSGGAPWSQTAAIVDRQVADRFIYAVLKERSTINLESLMSIEALIFSMDKSEEGLLLRLIPSLKRKEVFESLLMSSFPGVDWTREPIEGSDEYPILLKG
jgi:hypothetical protein